MSELRRRLFKVVSESQSEARQRAEPLEEAREGIAQLLRQTRERYGQSLRDVSANLRIRLAYLQAIEDGRFRELPGATYAVGFVRSYAEYLGLDSADIVRRFKGEVEGLESKIHLAFPEPVSEGKVPGGAIILLSLIVLAVGYGGWYAISNQGDEDAGFIPKVTGNFKVLVGSEPEAGSAPAPASDPQAATAGAPAQPSAAATGLATATAEVAPPAGQATGAAASTPAPGSESTPAAPSSDPSASASEQAVLPVQEEVAIGGPEEDDSAEPAIDTENDAGQAGAADVAGLPAAPDLPPAPALETASAGPVAPASATAETAPAGSGRITLRARLASWVQISDPSGTPILTRTLAAGESVDVPDRPGLTLFTGNAGGLEILVDGKSLSTLGPVGSVRRNIALDAAALLRQGSAQ